MGAAMRALAAAIPAEHSMPGPPAFPHTRFRMAAISAIVMTIASFGMIRDEAPVVASGTLTGADGKPIVGATVELRSGRQRDAVALSDEHGRWWLSGGHRIDSHQLAVATASLMPATAPLARARKITLHAFPTVAGAVVDDAGAPVSDAMVKLFRAHDKTRWTRVTAVDGTYSAMQVLAPGEFTLLISAADHDPFRSQLHLQPDQVWSLKAVLARQFGSISVASDPPGQTPLLDGRALASCTTPCTTDVLVGKHTLGFETDLYLPWANSLDVHHRDKTSYNAVLERKQGTLSVSVPAGELTVDGTPVNGELWTGRLPTGAHVVSSSADGAWPYARTVNVQWNQTMTVALGADKTAIVPGDQAAFLVGMNAYMKSVGGQYGIYLKDLKSGLVLGSGQDGIMEAASDIKVPLALYLLNQVGAGKVGLTDMVTLQDSDFMSGTGTLDGTASSGDRYSVHDLLSLMITISDNTAWQALMRALTPEAIDAYAASIGAPDCHQVDNNCTPRELGVMFEGIYRGSLLKPAENQLLLDLLAHTIFNERIPYYLGPTLVAHKTGADGGVMNDAGIVYLAGNPFIISVFTVTDDGQSGIQATRDVARAFANFLTPAPK